MREGVDDGGADAQAGERTRAGHESDFGEVLPVFVVFGEFVVDKLKQFFGQIVTGIPFIGLVV